MALIFQFGSNCSATRLNSAKRLNGAAQDLGLVRTKDLFELCFNVWSRGNNCAASDIRAGSGRNIYGVLYEVPDSELEHFDRIEGPLYQRVSIGVEKTDGMPIDGAVYTYLVREPNADIKTSMAYVTHILEGLKAHGASEEYIEYVRGRSLANNPDLKF